ncbi:hypothetical protein [Pontimicrobium sp. MEBiC01747]
MTLYEFNMLDTIDEKFQATQDYGIFIDSFVKQDIRYTTYAIDRFFVEVYYDRKTNSISDIQSFKHGSNLDKYAVGINFEDYY